MALVIDLKFINKIISTILLLCSQNKIIYYKYFISFSEAEFNRNWINIWNINEGTKIDHFGDLQATIWKIKVFDNN